MLSGGLEVDACRSADCLGLVIETGRYGMSHESRDSSTSEIRMRLLDRVGSGASNDSGDSSSCGYEGGVEVDSFCIKLIFCDRCANMGMKGRRSLMAVKSCA